MSQWALLLYTVYTNKILALLCDPFSLPKAIIVTIGLGLEEPWTYLAECNDSSFPWTSP